MKYRKKPVAIEAMQLPERYPDGEDPASDGYARNLQAAKVIDWLRAELPSFEPLAEDVPARGWAIDPATGFILIATLEGVMQAKPGDYIIRGVAGEFCPCKPSIFSQTYEPTEA